MRKIKLLLPKMILPQCVAAGQLVGVASFESTKQLIPAEKLAVTLPVFLGMHLLFLQERFHLECTGSGQILAPFTEKQLQDLLAVASVNTKREGKGKYKHTWAGCTLRASCEG